MKKDAEKIKVGIGLRSAYYDQVLNGEAKELDFFETITENYFQTRGRPFHLMHKIRQDFPFVSHGVSLNIGSIDPLDPAYIHIFKNFIEQIEPEIVSDHLCWTGAHSKNWYDLYPLPHTEEALKHVVDKIKQLQDSIGRRFALENVSTYLRFKDDEMSEEDFLIEVLNRADCELLLDVNNVFVNAFNHGFDAESFIKKIPPERVRQYHLAGHTEYEDFLFDTHDHPIKDQVWKLYEFAISEIGARPTLIERDDNFPELAEVIDEAKRAKSIMLKVKESQDDAA
jgi:uncharacterized protein (UPF0276 family)